jgi:hypothetical protein
MDKELREKIIALFEYRKLPELIGFGGHTWDQEYYERLIELQFHIYRLDHELESHWDVDLSTIEDRWKKIYSALEAVGIPQNMQERYCRHIFKYQKHELDIRQFRLPTRLSMEYFYFYKSCDVKLLRKIIYRGNQELSKVIKESQWRLFDLVTEVNDDVEDLQEDVATINGNRFLIGLKQFGKAETFQLFKSFLTDISNRNRSEVISFGSINLTRWTQEQVEATLKLMERQLEQFDQVDASLYDRLIRREIASLERLGQYQ